MTEEEYRRALVDFVAEEFLPGAEQEPLTDTTPLVESGILDSLRIAILLSFIRNTFGVAIPAAKIDPRNFADIQAIAAMIVSVSVVTTSERAGG
ncbi:acyl carrier protein [Frankia sp. AgPm24]|uniref:acyl carrier protein n=1 Tax=Frankia sp. AgPm24 TaxID=631128 RepID=UPI00200CE2A2|nr:acyl carrier protein [Frankia sp. AgPm24]MCK9922443.1 acyl carrier protein [Frankia sp. AgPm24]